MSGLLNETELASALFELDRWQGDLSGLTRTVELPTFRDAIVAVDAIADIAEELDHHPDIDIRWRTLTFMVATHSAGGVTAADVELCRRIDQELNQ